MTDKEPTPKWRPNHTMSQGISQKRFDDIFKKGGSKCQKKQPKANKSPRT